MNIETNGILTPDGELFRVNDTMSEENHLAKLFLSLKKFDLNNFSDFDQETVDKIQCKLEKIYKIVYELAKLPVEYTINFKHLEGIPFIQDLLLIMRDFRFPYIFSICTKIISVCLVRKIEFVDELMNDDFKQIMTTFLYVDSLTIKRSMMVILVNACEFYNRIADLVFETHFLADLFHYAIEFTTEHTLYNTQMFIDSSNIINVIFSKSPLEYVDYCFEDFVNYVQNSWNFALQNRHMMISLLGVIKAASKTETDRILSETPIFQQCIELLRDESRCYKYIDLAAGVCKALSILLYNTTKNDLPFEGFTYDVILNLIEAHQNATLNLGPLIVFATNVVSKGPPLLIDKFITSNVLRFFADISQKTYYNAKLEILVWFWEAGLIVNHSKFIDLFFPYLDLMFEIFESDSDLIVNMIIEKIIPFIRTWILESKEKGEPLVEIENALSSCNTSDNEQISSSIQEMLDLIAQSN